jgi:dTDP-glucose pyrophosphorylase
MIGVVLAAGAGRRLRPDTDALPKTLLPVDGETTIAEGWRADPGQRRPISWRTVWRMTAAGRPPVI